MVSWLRLLFLARYHLVKRVLMIQVNYIVDNFMYRLHVAEDLILDIYRCNGCKMRPNFLLSCTFVSVKD